MRLMPRSAAAVVRLVEELCERALECLEIEVKVEDLVDRDRLGREGWLQLRLGNDLLDLLDGASSDRQHHDERHLALGARDLQVEPLFLVAEDLYVAAFQAPSADRAVVEPSSVADELDDAHRWHITPGELVRALLPLAFYARAAGGANDRPVDRARRQDHAISGLQLDPPPIGFEVKRDGTVDAVKDLLVRMAVGCVAITGSVRPRVAARGLTVQAGHEVLAHAPDSKIAWVKPRFLADCNVGRLARWLRALGYDASYHARIGDAELVREAAAESRVLLTRDRDLTKRRVIQTGVVRAILIRDDDVTAQLRQVFTELGLELKEALTRCIECNAELQSRVPAMVAERVPPYVRRTQSRYSECPECGRIYWAGTHWQRMREVLAGL
jgi:uncharacterized protein with PIN domain